MPDTTDESSIGNADPSSVADPAAPSSANTDHTARDGTKPTTITRALTDLTFLPQTKNAPFLRQAQSYLVLFSLIAGVLLAARYLLGIEVLADLPLWAFVALSVATVGAVLAVGAGDIDWWELTLGYWWLSMPVAAAAGILAVRAGEGQQTINEVD